VLQVTGVSQYDKPDELKSEAEKALPPCPWQEFTNAQVGRVYYHNKVTKESVWEEPQELREYKMKLSALERGLPLPVMSAPVAAPVAAPAAAPVAAPTTAAAAAAVSAAPASSAAPAAAVVSAPGVAAAANGGAAAVAPGTVPSSAAAAAPAYGVWPPGMMMQGVGGMYPQMMAPGVLPPNVTAAAAAPKVVPAAVIPQGAAVAALSAGVVPDDSAAAKAMAAAMATLNGADSSAFISSGGGARKGVKKNPKDAPPVPVVNVRVEEEEKKPVVEKKASEPVYASQEERVAAFMALLEEVRAALCVRTAPRPLFLRLDACAAGVVVVQKKVPSTATWEEAMRIIIGDPRFKALNLAQKKSVFQEYNEKRAKVEREERDAAMSKARVRLHTHRACACMQLAVVTAACLLLHTGRLQAAASGLRGNRSRLQVAHHRAVAAQLAGVCGAERRPRPTAAVFKLRRGAWCAALLRGVCVAHPPTQPPTHPRGAVVVAAGLGERRAGTPAAGASRKAGGVQRVAEDVHVHHRGEQVGGRASRQAVQRRSGVHRCGRG
jgi:hypothetical protein